MGSKAGTKTLESIGLVSNRTHSRAEEWNTMNAYSNVASDVGLNKGKHPMAEQL